MLVTSLFRRYSVVDFSEQIVITSVYLLTIYNGFIARDISCLNLILHRKAISS